HERSTAYRVLAEVVTISFNKIHGNNRACKEGHCGKERREGLIQSDPYGTFIYSLDGVGSAIDKCITTFRASGALQRVNHVFGGNLITIMELSITQMEGIDQPIIRNIPAFSQIRDQTSPSVI